MRVTAPGGAGKRFQARTAAASGLGPRAVIPLTIPLTRPSRHPPTHCMRLTSTSALVLVAWSAGFAPAAEPVTFERHVRPILKAYCLDCHGAGEKMPGGLDLR